MKFYPEQEIPAWMMPLIYVGMKAELMSGEIAPDGEPQIVIYHQKIEGGFVREVVALFRVELGEKYDVIHAKFSGKTDIQSAVSAVKAEYRKHRP